MKILYTSPIIEHPPAGGPQLRIENSIKSLNLISELHVISRITKSCIGGNIADQFYRKHSFKFLYTHDAKNYFTNRYLHKLKTIWNRLFRITDADFIINYADKNSIKIIWFGYGNISYDIMKIIKQRRPDIKIVCDTDSVWSRFILRELPYEECAERRKQIELDGRKKEIEEEEWVNFCDVTTAVSEVDAQYYRELAKEPERIKIFSNVIDLNNYSISPQPPDNFKKPCIYLAGSFGPKSAMDKAARWIIKEVLPLVKEKIPDIHFYIVGRGSDYTLGDVIDQNITVTGKSNSVLPYLCNVDVALVSLMFESGTRFKILEAGACGIPIVSTTLGAEGIPVTDGENILIADKPNDFANAIIKILTCKEYAQNLALNCKKLIETRYSIEQLEEEGKIIIEFLGGKT